MKSCGECQHGKRLYADGNVLKDWSGRDTPDTPAAKDSKYWTYLECTKNNKGLKHLNLDGKCPAFQVRKS